MLPPAGVDCLRFPQIFVETLGMRQEPHPSAKNYSFPLPEKSSSINLHHPLVKMLFHPQQVAFFM